MPEVRTGAGARHYADREGVLPLAIVERRVGHARFVGLFLAYISFRWPDMRIKDRLGFMSIYAALAGLWLVLSALIGMLSRYDYMSLGLGPVLACLVLGAVLGCRGRKPPQGDAAMP